MKDYTIIKCTVRHKIYHTFRRPDRFMFSDSVLSKSKLFLKDEYDMDGQNKKVFGDDNLTYNDLLQSKFLVKDLEYENVDVIVHKNNIKIVNSTCTEEKITMLGPLQSSIILKSGHFNSFDIYDKVIQHATRIQYKFYIEEIFEVTQWHEITTIEKKTV